MKKRLNPKQMLLNLALNEGLDVVHLPYTQEFEAVCHKIKPSATTEDKHRFWENLLKLRASTASDDSAVESQFPQTQSPVRNQQITSKPPERVLRPQAETGSLFDPEPSVSDIQPWSLPPEIDLTPEKAEQRRKMLAGIANSDLAEREQRIAFILQHFPETRDSDTALCIRYWKMFQADVLERWQPLELEVLFKLDRIETLGRLRRFIQNELRLFRGVEDTRRAREAFQAELHEYLQVHRATLPEIRFYLDETGNEGDKTYAGIAGVCVINWKQYEKYYAALELWRASQGPETIHFSETGDERRQSAVSLLNQVQKRRGGILFLGYSLLSRGRTNEDLFSLFIHLVMDSLRHLRDRGCLSDNRSVRVLKEAESGFDSVFLKKMTKGLEEAIALEFPGQLAVLPVQAVTKGRNVLLECADLIAGGMQRRALKKGRNPKDLLAEAVINLTGFEDTTDTGALFKFFPMGN